MGAHAYWYYVKYEANLQAALDKLRQVEFKAGRYNPVMPFIDFPIHAKSPAPGAQHASIDEAQNDAAEDGTRSILDINDIADEAGFCTASPLSDEVLESFYGTTKPTREQVEEMEFLEDAERGEAVYVILYEADSPTEILFAGYSFD